MLTRRYKLRGVSLIELAIAIAILVIVLAATAPGFAEWIQNNRIRNAADSIQNGLSLARSEAVHRNAITQFIACKNSAEIYDGAWEIVAASAAASVAVCGAAISAGWQRVRAQSAQSAVIDTMQPTVGFNGMGRQVSTTDLVNGGATASPPVTIDINVSASTAGTACFCPAGNCGYPAGVAYSSAGTQRCLRISVSPGGQVRMCDPVLPAGSPQGC